MSKAKSKGKRFVTLILDEPLHIPDPVTGEVREATRIVLPYGYKDKDFCKVYYGALKKLADLPKSAQRVLDWCLENMNTENKVYIPNQKELGKKLGLAYITVRKAISLLAKQGFLKKVNTALYMVNPHIACKVSDPRDLVVHFVDSETFEEFVESATRREKAVR